MLADENSDLRALAVKQILTIHMKAQEQSQASNQQEDDGMEVDDLDDDNELAEENDDDFKWTPLKNPPSPIQRFVSTSSSTSTLQPLLIQS